MTNKIQSSLELDRKYVWHPFTNMDEWLDDRFDVVTIARGKGAWLFDTNGKKYLDGNSSIWTNIHGHRHPKLDAALRKQLTRIAHSSFLGLSNDVAPVLAQRLVDLLRAPEMNYRVFFSDDGSTAIEAAVKIAIQARLQRGEPKRTRFVSIRGGYHGDTVGAMSLSHTPQFHKPFEKIIFQTESFAGPQCYRCQHNQAGPTRGTDQRLSRQCKSECLEDFDKFISNSPETICAIVMEPRVQGAAGMWMHPPGFLEHVAKRCKEHGIWLILDEVMTGFGRTGALFACDKENVKPDFIALAKGLTGGYLPLGATIVSDEIFRAFTGKDARGKTFFHGHSYCGNALGCAVALANLDLFKDDGVMTKVASASKWLARATEKFWEHPNVGDVRQEGMICAIELVEGARLRRPFDSAKRTGFHVCRAAVKYGLLTRPIGDVLVLMPPFCVTKSEVNLMTEALWSGLCDVLPTNSAPSKTKKTRT